MEHLFKLKKDGKTVGYLKYDKYRPDYNNDLDVYGKFIDDGDDKWCEGVTPEFDAMYPFVTRDKNGKDVFEGDRVQVNGIIVIVTQDTTDCRYMLSSIPGQCCYPPALYDNMGSKFVWSEIELIEDKEDGLNS